MLVLEAADELQDSLSDSQAEEDGSDHDSLELGAGEGVGVAEALAEPDTSTEVTEVGSPDSVPSTDVSLDAVGATVPSSPEAVTLGGTVTEPEGISVSDVRDTVGETVGSAVGSVVKVSMMVVGELVDEALSSGPRLGASVVDGTDSTEVTGVDVDSVTLAVGGTSLIDTEALEGCSDGLDDGSLTGGGVLAGSVAEGGGVGVSMLVGSGDRLGSVWREGVADSPRPTPIEMMGLVVAGIEVVEGSACDAARPSTDEDGTSADEIGGGEGEAVISAPGAGDTVGSAVTEGDGSALTAELGVTAVEGSSVGILEDTPSAEARGVAVGSIATGEEEGVSDIGTDADGSPDVADSEVADGEGAGGGVDGTSEVGATLLEVSETETGGTSAVDEVVSVVTGLEAASVTDVESTGVASVGVGAEDATVS